MDENYNIDDTLEEFTDDVEEQTLEPITQEPNILDSRLERLEQMIESLAASREEPPSDPTWEDEIAEKVAAKFGAQVEPLLRQTKQIDLVNRICEGLGDDARAKVADYLQNYNASGLDQVASDKATMAVLRGFALSESKAVSAPKTDKAGGTMDANLGRFDAEIDNEARRIASSLGIPYDVAKKQVTADYKEALKNAN